MHIYICSSACSSACPFACRVARLLSILNATLARFQPLHKSKRNQIPSRHSVTLSYSFRFDAWHSIQIHNRPMCHKKLWWTPSFSNSNQTIIRKAILSHLLHPNSNHNYNHDDQLQLISPRLLPPTVSPNWPEHHTQFASVDTPISVPITVMKESRDC